MLVAVVVDVAVVVTAGAVTLCWLSVKMSPRVRPHMIYVTVAPGALVLVCVVTVTVVVLVAPILVDVAGATGYLEVQYDCAGGKVESWFAMSWKMPPAHPGAAATMEGGTTRRPATSLFENCMMSYVYYG